MNETRADVATRAPGPLRTETVRRALLDHYDRERRALPWRGETDPYRIWVSEVMLQQTRVDTVVPYYRAWLERFPDVRTLADADLDEVLVRWEGLGYYRRARHLHQGAAFVRDRHGGRLPRTIEALREIPGVGEYTAAAVASIAFDVRAGAVDGNVRRVLARLFDEPDPTPAWLRERADALVDPARPGDWNQAMMDLGATVCTPRAPSCGSCPWEGVCAARRAGTQSERPRSKPRAPVPTTRFAVAVVVDREDRTLVRRRPDTGLLAGLWAFPDAELAEGSPGSAVERAARGAAEAGSIRLGPEPGVVLEEVRHRFTHLEARYVPVLLRGAGPDGPDARWLPLVSPEGVALPVAQRRIAAVARSHHGVEEPPPHADT